MLHQSHLAAPLHINIRAIVGTIGSLPGSKGLFLVARRHLHSRLYERRQVDAVQRAAVVRLLQVSRPRLLPAGDCLPVARWEQGGQGVGRGMGQGAYRGGEGLVRIGLGVYDRVGRDGAGMGQGAYQSREGFIGWGMVQGAYQGREGRGRDGTASISGQDGTGSISGQGGTGQGWDREHVVGAGMGQGTYQAGIQLVSAS